MHIEHLSKSQIVLLTLLVSFVTSIATGIITVSLMEQAPPAVAQTVNRVIERTVEKVTPAGQTAATVITREKTVVVKESELISQAVERAAPSLVRLYAGSGESSVFLGLGFVSDSAGGIITDASTIDDRSEVQASLSDGSRVRAFVTSRDKGAGTAVLHAATSTVDGKTPAFKNAALGVSAPVLGQTVISLSGKTAVRIGSGIVTAIGETDGEKKETVIDTNIATDSILPGSILVSAEGQVIGISTHVSRRQGESAFISGAALRD